jgi:hypothetical protein
LHFIYIFLPITLHHGENVYNLTMSYLFPEMNIHLNMLGILMLHRFTIERNGTNIVRIHQVA